MKIRPVGVELLHADGRTDGMTKLIVAFRSSADAPKARSYTFRKKAMEFTK